MDKSQTNDQNKETNRTLILGTATFKFIQKKQLISDYGYQRVFYGIHWNIGSSKEWIKIFHHMIMSRCIGFDIQRGRNKNILKQIQHIKFTSIQYLTLSGNYINNIEALSLIDLPSLQTLFMGDNYISRIRSLVKLNNRKLNQLTFQNNSISQIKDIQRVRFSSQIRHLSMQHYKQDHTASEDQSILMKLESLSIKRYWTSKNRIRIKKIENVMYYKRFLYIQVTRGRNFQ